MAEQGVDTARRRFLTATVSTVGGAGCVVGAIPFIVSMQPSARAQAAGAPVEADISKLESGQLLIFEWRGKPVWIVRRDQQSLAALDGLKDTLADPESKRDQQPAYARNEFRSINPEIMVLVGICTHLGCSPKYRPDLAPADLGADWQGGFFCPCHGSKFDLAGRVYAGVPAPSNLIVPPHTYLSDTRILIGVDEETA
ncbi:MAG: ubiquinol-cytochrome c reductase iron-sulfur subunit [Gammaproteobacteria bacterium]|nr:ubiquinol-cytochrome c reductase iron-sulfur subunit [Gammaproteobacteria bacterium]